MGRFELFRKCSFLFVAGICFFSMIPPKEQQSKKKINVSFEKYNLIIITAILIVGALVRFYKLAELPIGFHVDEAAMAYDALCIKEYGMDRWLNKNPVYLINYGGGQSALMAYLVSFCYSFLGNGSVWAIRLPTAVMGVLAILVVFLLTKKIADNTTAVLAAFFTAIFPSLIKMSRFALDCYLMYSVVILAIYVLVIAIEKKKIFLFALSGFLWGISLYTYAISYVFVPIFLGVTILYLLYFKKINWSQIITMGIPLGVMAMPLMLMLAINSHIIPYIELNFITIPILPFYRGGEIRLGTVADVVHSIYNLLVFDGWLYNSDKTFNTVYLISIPLVFVGVIKFLINFIKSIKNKTFDKSIIIFSYIISSIVLLIVVSGPCVNKLNVIYPLLAILAAVGMLEIFKKSDILGLAVIGIYMIYFCAFSFSYFVNANPMPLFSDNIEFAVDKVEKICPDKHVYICDNMMDIKYEALALALQVDPHTYVKNKDVQKIGNYQLKIPVYLDENENLCEEINDDCVYVLRKSNMTETFEYIRTKLDENNFIKDSTTYYDIYYKNAN